jgi:hypothetical protein
MRTASRVITTAPTSSAVRFAILSSLARTPALRMLAHRYRLGRRPTIAALPGGDRNPRLRLFDRLDPGNLDSPCRLGHLAATSS